MSSQWSMQGASSLELLFPKHFKFLSHCCLCKVHWTDVSPLATTWLVPAVPRAGPLSWSGQDILGQILLNRQPQWLWDIKITIMYVWGVLIQSVLSARDGCVTDASVGACVMDVIGPPGQGRRLQGLLRTLLGLSWERRTEYDDICGHKVCLCCSPITCAQISSGREMIDLLQKEWTTTQALQKARETSWGESKDNPSSNLYFNCILGSNPHNKIEHWSLHLLWLWTHRQLLKI